MLSGVVTPTVSDSALLAWPKLNAAVLIILCSFERKEACPGGGMYAATIAAILIIFGTVLIIVSIKTDSAVTVSVAAWIVVIGSVILSSVDDSYIRLFEY